MTIQDIIKLRYTCTCAEIYKSRGLVDPDCIICEQGEEIALIAVEFNEQEEDKLSQLHNRPRQVLKPLEDLWRKENSLDKFVLPDTTEFLQVDSKEDNR